MWCEPEFHRAGHGKMFMENKENESLKISAKLVDLEDAEEFLKNLNQLFKENEFPQKEALFKLFSGKEYQTISLTFSPFFLILNACF